MKTTTTFLKLLTIWTCLQSSWATKGAFRERILSDEQGNNEEKYVSTNSVAIIGGGMSGLTAAYNLQKLGYSVTVFEAENRLGGKIESVNLGSNGAPTTGAISLEPDMEAKAQALCGDSNQRPTDLGAVIATGGNIKALADELDVPYGNLILEAKIVVTLPNGQILKLSRSEYFGLVASQAGAPTGQDPQSVIAAALQAFFGVVQQFPEIKTPRLDDNNLELAMPTSEFAAKYGISVLVEALRPVVTGYGYGYFETVPAGITLQYMYPIIASVAGLPTDTVSIAFPCGFQSLPEAMAQNMDVRLGAPVTSIKRKNKFVLVKAEGQPALKFDLVVIATTLDVVSNFLDDMDANEQDLFGRLVFNRYISTVTNVQQGIDASYEVEFYADQGFEENINQVNALAKSDTATSGELAYQIVDTSITQEEAFQVLQNDMQSYWQGSATGVIAQKDVFNYFPRVSSDDFASGFYNRMEALQGTKNTYYVGSYLSFETVTFAEAYARDLIQRKFVAV